MLTFQEKKSITIWNVIRYIISTTYFISLLVLSSISYLLHIYNQPDTELGSDDIVENKTHLLTPKSSPSSVDILDMKKT